MTTEIHQYEREKRERIMHAIAQYERVMQIPHSERSDRDIVALAKACMVLFENKKRHFLPQNIITTLLSLLPKQTDEQWLTQELYYCQGYCFFQLGESQKAEEYLKKHLEMGGLNPRAEYYLRYLAFAKALSVPCYEVEEGGTAQMAYSLEICDILLRKLGAKTDELLNSGATPAEIQATEEYYGLLFPESLRYLYQKHNGQCLQSPWLLENYHFLNIAKAKEKKDFLAQINHRAMTLKSAESWEEENRQYAHYQQDIDGLWPIMQAEDGCLVCVATASGTSHEKPLLLVEINEQKPCIVLSYFAHSLRHATDHLNKELYEQNWVFDEEKKSVVESSLQQESIRYTDQERTALEKHIVEKWGQYSYILRDEQACNTPIDLYIITPKEERNYYTIITLGMGAYAMHTEQFERAEHYCELVIQLPPQWNIYKNKYQYQWALSWIKKIAQYPISTNSFLAHGHTIITKGAEKAGAFGAFLVLSATEKPQSQVNDLCSFTEENGRKIAFYQLLALFEEEATYKANHSIEKLLTRMNESGIANAFIADDSRKNSCMGYTPQPQKEALREVKWLFSTHYYDNDTDFYHDVRQYNEKIGHPLQGFAPFAMMLHKRKVLLEYQAYLTHPNQALAHESTAEPFWEQSQPQCVSIIAEITAQNGQYFTPIELLRQLHNSLCNKINERKAHWNGTYTLQEADSHCIVQVAITYH